MIRWSFVRFSSTSNDNTPTQESQPTFNHLSFAKPMRRMSTFLMDKVLSPGSRRNSTSNRKITSIDEHNDAVNKDGCVNDELGKKINETGLYDHNNCKQYVNNSTEGNHSDSPTAGCCGTCFDCTM